MWLGDKVVYTPEIIIIRRGKSVEGVVIAMSRSEFTIKLPDGTENRVERRLCDKVK